MEKEGKWDRSKCFEEMRGAELSATSGDSVAQEGSESSSEAANAAGVETPAHSADHSSSKMRSNLKQGAFGPSRSEERDAERSLSPASAVASPWLVAADGGRGFGGGGAGWSGATGDEESVGVRDVLRLLWLHRFKLAACVATAVLLGALHVLTATPLYRASALLQIDPEDANVLPYEEISKETRTGNSRDYLLTQTRNLETRTLAERTLLALDESDREALRANVRKGFPLDQLRGSLRFVASLLASTPREVEGIDPREIDDFLGRLQTRQLRETRMVEVSFESHDPQLSADVINVLTAEFIQQHLQVKFDATVQAGDFLASQLEDLRETVERSEQEMVDYAREHNIVNVGESEEVSLQRLADLNEQMTQAEASLLAHRARYEQLRGATVSAFPPELENETTIDLSIRLSDLRSRHAAKRSEFGDGWLEVRELQGQIREVEQQLRSQRRLAIDRVRREYETAQSLHDRLTEAVATQQLVVDQLNEDSIQYSILQRQVETSQALYEGLLQRLKEAGVAAGLRSSNVRIADAARAPLEASSPRKLRVLILSLLLGLVLGVGLALLTEATDTTVKSSDEVEEAIGLPALSVIPAAGEGLASLGGRPLLLSHSSGAGLPSRRLAESYRSLRTAILLSSSGRPPQTMLVTSVLPSEGKTTTASNLGTTLAQNGARTLLVDADLRRPALAGTFGLGRAADHGLSLYLVGNHPLAHQIRSTSVENLYILPAGPPPPNPVELLGSRRMDVGLELLRGYFDHIVIDTSPFLELSDTLLLANQVDGVVVVVKAGSTPLDAVRRGCQRLRSIGANILGVVLNDIDDHGAGSGDYYGQYGGYYDAYFSANATNVEGRREGGAAS